MHPSFEFRDVLLNSLGHRVFNLVGVLVDGREFAAWYLHPNARPTFY
jgi:hypothetical protein